MTCKDCVHYEPCRDTYYNNEEQTRIPFGFLEKDGVDKDCAFFKDRSKFIELPCKVGDKFYLIDKYPPDIKEKEVCGFTIENGEIVFIDENDSRYGRYWFNEEIVFTREKAEKRLEELKGEGK